MQNDGSRARQVEATLRRLACESDIPEWLLEALRLANGEAGLLTIGEEAPAGPPQFLYPH
jgi:hypothetical protein